MASARRTDEDAPEAELVFQEQVAAALEGIDGTPVIDIKIALGPSTSAGPDSL
jgi:tRNA (Thr-GGU) A37 N-methylase